MDKLDVTVLHVEDNKAFRGLFKYLIKPEVSEFYTAQNGKEGFEIFKLYRPDIVVTDIDMPEMDGIELSKKIKEIAPEIPIIVFSSVERETYLLEAINIGIEQFVLKDEDNFKEILHSIRRSAKEVELRKKSAEQENRIRMLSRAMEQSGSIIIISDPEGYIEYANEAFFKATGFEINEILGRHIIEFKDEKYREFFEEAMNGSQIVGEYMQKKKNGESFWAASRISPIRNAEDKITNLVEASDDISAHKEAEKAIEKANYARRNFLANMSHELRTPLNGVIGIASILLETDTTLEQREYLNLQKTSAEALLKIINDLLDFSQIEDNKLEILHKPFDLTNAISLTLNFFKLAANEKNLKLEYRIEEGIYNYLIGDERRIQQIINNLIGNSIKFTEKGLVEVLVKKEYDDEEKVTLVFSVKDSGIGVPKDKFEHIFGRFTQADSSFTRKYGGTGLGLAISKDLVRLMNGDIWVESEEGVGSEFFFRLELFKVTNEGIIAAIKNRNTKFVAPKLSNNIIKILLVEDNLMNQKIVIKGLRSYGHDITTANNGQEAVDIYKENNFDLTLMDVEMPIMNGIDAAAAMRQIEKEIGKKPTQIVALTAHIGKETQQKCFAAGMDDFLMKPINFELLFDIIEKIKINSGKEGGAPKNEIVVDLINPKYLDSKMFRKNLVKHVLDELPILIDELRINIKNSRFEEANIIAHRVKSAFNLVGAHKARKMIADIEFLIKSNDKDALNKNINTIVIETLNLVNYISNNSHKLSE
jgi:PAS domain S-box-containing protein